MGINNTDLFNNEVLDTDIALVANIEEQKFLKDIPNKYNIYKEETFSLIDFGSRGFISAETWSKSINLHARIIQITKHQIACECVLDRENQIFETRMFSRELFEHIRNLKEKLPILINIRIKPGSTRIDIYDGKGVVNESIFELKDSWDSLKNSGLDKAITFEND